MTLTRAAHGPYEFDNTGNVYQGTGPYTTASFTPAANSLLVVFVQWASQGTTADASVGVLTDSVGLSWTRRAQRAVLWTTGEVAIMDVWTAPVGVSPASMTLTFTHTTVNSYQMAVYPFTYTGHNGTGASAANNVTAATITLTLSGTPLITSEVIGMARMVEGASSSIAPSGAGVVEIREDIFAAEFERYQAESRVNSTSTSFAWAFTNRPAAPYDKVFAVALEIKAALAHPPFRQPRRFFTRGR